MKDVQFILNMSLPSVVYTLQVRCSALPQSLLHQAVRHPLAILRLPFRKLERQAGEAKAALLACPLASACNCRVRKSIRLARHVASSHAPQLLDLSRAVAKISQAWAVSSTGDGGVNMGKEDLGSDRSSLSSCTGTADVCFTCPCCVILASTSQTGLPSILDWGYAKHEDPSTQGPVSRRHPKGGLSSASDPVLGQFEVQSKARKQFSTWKDLSDHIALEHEGLMICLAAYVSGLGSGSEGTPCPLATPSAEMEATQRIGGRGVRKQDGGGSLPRRSHHAHDGFVSCPGVGRFVFDSVEGLLEHSIAVHMEHLLQVGNVSMSI